MLLHILNTKSKECNNDINKIRNMFYSFRKAPLKIFTVLHQNVSIEKLKSQQYFKCFITIVSKSKLIIYNI